MIWVLWSSYCVQWTTHVWSKSLLRYLIFSVIHITDILQSSHDFDFLGLKNSFKSYVGLGAKKDKYQLFFGACLKTIHAPSPSQSMTPLGWGGMILDPLFLWKRVRWSLITSTRSLFLGKKEGHLSGHRCSVHPMTVPLLRGDWLLPLNAHQIFQQTKASLPKLTPLHHHHPPCLACCQSRHTLENCSENCPQFRFSVRNWKTIPPQSCRPEGRRTNVGVEGPTSIFFIHNIYWKSCSSYFLKRVTMKIKKFIWLYHHHHHQHHHHFTNQMHYVQDTQMWKLF